ncbi:Sphingoid long-chain bases kinase 2 [Citrus sinensis]|uniref:Sphingoid long-chain bases kinase 2 n=2 Tax=Citrus TaxID=2706 RepID=A0ACB8MPH6_CITSI|nr:hypothetical protein CICLE_v10020792mg [Citrus x clementina]KAH9731802.1 Sphingoid long-chain bases kinase 2 [Citrus sinensis]KAH9732503.1 Sphingoid long-chain bases kinase 2 [Citrus sinensis]KAH9787724.1 Sphingoid long-chain bases kinase 2 [Citrus sinensis]GAY51445.1 hypothetical protein CUMW_134290 [Citrus unshiu]
MICLSQFALGRAPPMAKPSVFRAEHPMALDLSPNPISHGAASSSRRRDLVFVVNPRGASGRTGKEWKKLLPYLRSRLSVDCNICESLTSGPSHAIDITREAIKEGADAVIAVGGDGTLHEVVNGFFSAGKLVTNHNRESAHSTALGLIPLGTGSDFARTFGWRNDPYEAVERIAKGVRSWVDVGVINGETGEPHYFINVADLHLSAKAGYYASRYKRFGNLCYVIGALQAFMGHRNQDLRVKVVILQDFKWYDFILKLLKLYNGTHLSVKNVTSRRAHSIEVEDISSGDSIYVQSDGEHLGFLPRKLCVLPAAIEMIC